MPKTSVETERREQILAAACDVVADIGFKSLRVADVARRAGTSTGTVHYHFETKTALMRAAFEWNFTRSLARRRHLLDEVDDPRVRLEVFVDSYLPVDEQTVHAWRVWAELWVEAMHDTELQDLNEQVYGEWRRIIAGVIRDGQVAGQFRPEDPVTVANALIGMIDGLALQVLAGSRSMTADRMRQVCHQMLRALTA